MTALENLVHCTEDLLTKGGSITRRNALEGALNQVRVAASLEPSLGPEWQFTPPVLRALAIAKAISKQQGDPFIRLCHMEEAMKRVQV